MAGPVIPAATYRLQFNRRFRFNDALVIVPYLNALGVSDIYASPLLAAGRGSAHGYDVTDPARLNPELGSSEEFAALAGSLRCHGMGLLLDIVPNHMAASTENPWWRDVLRNGRHSAYAAYFDIDWRPAQPGLAGKVLLPVLGEPFGKVLENRELTIEPDEDGFAIRYFQRRLPLNPRTTAQLLARWAEAPAGASGTSGRCLPPQWREFSEELKVLLDSMDKKESAASLGQLYEKFWRLYGALPEVKAFVDGELRLLNGRRGDPRSFDRLEQILAEQAYRLAFWWLAGEEINYRRFFDVNELVALRGEEKQVFEATHAFVFRLVEAGLVTGLRIDHIDGLADPQTYLERLQDRLATPGRRPGFYVVVEKILAGGEKLPDDWPVYGTTGYDFLNMVNALFIDGNGTGELNRLYSKFSGFAEDFATVVYDRKRRVMAMLFAGEVRSLARRLIELAAEDRHGHDLTPAGLERAIDEVIACLDVYRTYIRDFTVSERDRRYIEQAVHKATRLCPAAGPACAFLGRVLLLEFPDTLPREKKETWLRFVRRWQQFTGPVMAKGFEDTALYVYNRLVSLNEVGGEPGTPGITVGEFHRRNKDRKDRLPHTLNATSTHDTKRSEDVRARINVLSEISAAWARRVENWRRWNGPKKPVVNGLPVPEDNTEYLIYQTMAGAWPLREDELPAFRERLQAYLVKAAREAKIHTSWLEPDTGYEEALKNFASAILEPGENNHFLRDFLEFQRGIACYGAVNSLSQTLLKITSPGIPDFYQGTELWDFSLVDPDNRRPVDFGARAGLLETLKREEARGLPDLVKKLTASWKDGRVKLYLTYKALNFRRDHRELFASGEYILVETTGSGVEHACAFARRLTGFWVLVAVPRLPARLCLSVRASGEIELPATGILPEPAVWKNGVLILPGQAPTRWRNILTGEELPATVAGAPPGEKYVLPLAGMFRNFPVALLAEG